MKNYNSILMYFDKFSFGSQLPVLSILSSLPPFDRCEIIKQIIGKGSNNIEAYSKLSMAYLKDGNREEAFNLLKNANQKGNIDDYSFKILSNKIIGLDNAYQGNFGSAQGYDQTIGILENLVSESSKTEFSEFYNIVYQFAKMNLH